jgi:hypothetical protein
MPASDSGATYTSGRRPKAAKERTRGGWGAENAAHTAMACVLKIMVRFWRHRPARSIHFSDSHLRAETPIFSACLAEPSPKVRAVAVGSDPPVAGKGSTGNEQA